MKIEKSNNYDYPLTTDDLEEGECYERRWEGTYEYILVTDEDSFICLDTGAEYRLALDDSKARYRHLPNAMFLPEG